MCLLEEENEREHCYTLFYGTMRENNSLNLHQIINKIKIKNKNHQKRCLKNSKPLFLYTTV